MRLALKALLFFAAGLGSAPAFALEDHIVLQGRFDWIVEGGGGNIDDAVKRHLIPNVQIDRQPGGLFRADVTMPPTLSGGVAIKTTYLQKPTNDLAELYLENPVLNQDYIKCFRNDDESWDDVSWNGIKCNEITLHSLNGVPLPVRQKFAQDHYAGTNLGAGMGQAVNAVSGAQPGGTLRLFSKDQGDYPAWVGRWAVTYTSPTGQAIHATMFWDGFSGSYQAGTSRGALRNTEVEGDSATGDWEMGSSAGYFEFHKSGNGAFTGTWNSDEGNQSGTWNGTRIN